MGRMKGPLHRETPYKFVETCGVSFPFIVSLSPSIRSNAIFHPRISVVFSLHKRHEQKRQNSKDPRKDRKSDKRRAGEKGKKRRDGRRKKEGKEERRGLFFVYRFPHSRSLPHNKFDRYCNSPLSLSPFSALQSCPVLFFLLSAVFHFLSKGRFHPSTRGEDAFLSNINSENSLLTPSLGSRDGERIEERENGREELKNHEGCNEEQTCVF